MALINFGYRVDMFAIDPPSYEDAFIIAYDLDGVLKQKDHLGVVTLVGAGAVGPQGPPGPVGPAGLTWSGSWTATQSYSLNYVVGYASASWWCVLGVTGATGNDSPDIDTTHWALLAAQGSPGSQGGQGLMGLQGPKGATGATGSAVGSLPVPKLKLMRGGAPINYLSLDIASASVYIGGAFSLNSYPVIVAQDLSDVQIELAQNNCLFVEMVHYRRKTRRHNYSNNSAGYVTAGVNYVTWPNYLPWSDNFWVRNNSGQALVGGYGASGSIVRENFYQVTGHNSTIPVYNMLNNRFHEYDVNYRDSGGTTTSLQTIIPTVGYNRAGKNLPTSRFAYSPYYTPYYIAFRYIVYTPDNKIISGPLSNIVKITHEHMPFKYDYDLSNQNGLPVATINDNYNKLNLKCWLETKLP